jgi:glycosyltransferase involved in cell wall biosynthesis
MNFDLPLVSVIVPAYNAETFIGHTLNSILAQTYKNIEVLVVDDGSQDRTAEIVKLIAQRDHRVILLQQANAGVAAARNLAIKKSRGEYIAPIDADDIWYPQKLKKQVQSMLQAEPSVGLVYAWSVDINEEGLLTGGYNASLLEGKVYIPLVYGNFLGHASVPLIRRTCLEKVGYYNCQLKEQNAQGCEDTDIYLRIAEHYQFQVVPEFLVKYRKTISSMSCNYTSMAKSHNLLLADVQQRHPEIPSTIYQWARSNFYKYLAGQSRRCGNHWSTLFWLYKSLQIDSMNLLCNKLYKMSIKSFLKLIAQPITSLLWSDHSSWLQFKQRFKSNHPVITIEDINRKINKPQQLLWWKPYAKVRLQRFSLVLQSNQPVSPIKKMLIIPFCLPSIEG